MDLKNKIKDIVGEETFAALKKLVFTAEERIFKEAKLADGTIIRYDGDTPQEGAKVTVVTAEGEAPAGNGEYELEDGTIISVTDGAISAVKAKEASKEEAPKEDMEEEVQLADYPWEECIKDQTARYGDDETANKVCAAIKNGTVGMRAYIDAKADIVDLQIAFNKIEKEREELKKELEKNKEITKGIFTIIEKIAEMPAAEPTEKPNSFKKENKLSKISGLAEEINKLKTK